MKTLLCALTLVLFSPLLWAESFDINLDPLEVQKIDVIQLPTKARPTESGVHDTGLAEAGTEAGSIGTETQAGQDTGELIIYWSIAKGYKAYVEAFKLKITPNIEVVNFEASPVHSFTDPLTGEIKEGTQGTGQMRVHFQYQQTASPNTDSPNTDSSNTSTSNTDSHNKARGASDLPLDAFANPQAHIFLTYQACTKKNCLFPTTKKLPLQLEKKLEPLQAPVHVPDSWWARLQAYNVQSLMQQNWLLVFLLVFVAGLITSLTPCVLPMIPITLAVLGVRKQGRAHSRREAFIISLVYVLGIALTYSSLGVLAASTGMLFGSLVSNPWVMGGVFLFFMAMGLSLLGVFDVHLPSAWAQKLQGISSKNPRWGAFVAGLVAGVVAGPCVGPVLAGVLMFVATSQNVLLGFALLFTFSMGLGVLFIVMGVFQNMLSFLKHGMWMLWLKKALGVGLMITAVYLVWPVGKSLWSSPQSSSLSAMELDATGATMAMQERGAEAAARMAGVQANPAAATSDMAAAKVRTGSSPSRSAPAWKPYSEVALQQAQQAGRPVVLDVYADWCVACAELEKLTFSQPRVLALAPRFDWLKFDATNSSPELKKLSSTYGIVGLPWVMFFDAKGQLRRDLTLTGFEDATAFTGRLQKNLR